MERQKKIEKSRDGVPIWDCDAATFQEYEEASLLWEQGIASHKRYLSAPRLVAELTGTARRYVLGKRHDWVSYNGGVVKLMEHLRSRLGLPQLPELTEHLTRYFKQGRRRRGETMNDYITRKTETYTRAQQSLGRVLKAYGQTSSRWSGASSQVTSRPDLQWQRSTTSATPSVPEEEEIGENDGSQNAMEPEEDDPWARSSQSHGTQQGWQSSYSAWDQWWGYDAWSQTAWHSDDADWTTEAPEILPDMIQGWYLLGDSGLDTGERNMILAAIKQDFSFDRVAQELRNQWPDDDLRRRDQNNRQSGWWMDEADSGEDDNAFIAMDDLNEEGQALVVAAQEEVDRALLAMQNGRRTLREAREKQHQVRMSRKYYKTTLRSGQKGSGKWHDHKGTGTCLRCGGDHRTANCPKSTSTAATASEEHTAPFVCFAEDDLPEYAQGNLVENAFTGSVYAAAPPSTEDVVSQGKAVLDGGATRTIGSVRALERLMELNYERNGSNGLKSLNLDERPTFGFGNSTRNQCVSTAAFKIEADGREGHLQIHALDSGEGPVLFSIASLRALGAVIDFAEDLVCFRSLNDKKVIQLERSCTGHQLLPLTQDWYEDSKTSDRSIPSLREYI